MPPTPDLTPRQRAFLDELMRLWREREAPVHYSDVASRLGVGRFSAYDMLKVLEKKGYASVSYALAAGQTGPGRSMVLFSPTPLAATVLAPESQSARLNLGEEWQTVRRRILGRLREARGASARDTLSDLLSRLLEARTPMVFCAEMIGALLLNLRRARGRAAGLNPYRALAALRGNGTVGLEALAGLSVGATLATDDESGPSVTRRLLDYVHRYQVSLPRLTEEARLALAQFLEEALEALD